MDDIWIAISLGCIIILYVKFRKERAEYYEKNNS